MYFTALQNQHGTCFRTEEEIETKLFSILCVPLQNDFLELGKMLLNLQGAAHNPVPWIENTDLRIFKIIST